MNDSILSLLLVLEGYVRSIFSASVLIFWTPDICFHGVIVPFIAKKRGCVVHFIDDGLTNAILFIDLKKTCDTIDHRILLSKLELYGFKGASINLFRALLSGRTQVTVINNVNSETSFIRCGVPEGSFLGPLLFLLYINELPNCNLLSDVRM